MSPQEHLLNFSINNSHVELLVIYLVLLKIHFLYSKQDVYHFPLRKKQAGHIYLKPFSKTRYIYSTMQIQQYFSLI